MDLNHDLDELEPEPGSAQAHIPFLPPFETPVDVRIASELSLIFFDDIITCQYENCSKVFTSSQCYRSHRKKFHGTSSYYCVICCAPYHFHADLVRHIEMTGHKITCSYCPDVPCHSGSSSRIVKKNTFNRPTDAALHYVNHHKLHVCTNCSTSLLGKNAFKYHVKTVCNQDDENLAFAASSCVETTMNSSFSETRPELTNNEDDVQILEELQTVEYSEVHQLFSELPNVTNCVMLPHVEEISSDTDTAVSDSVMLEYSNVTENNATVAISSTDCASQSQGELFNGLELLSHHTLASGEDELDPLNNSRDVLIPNTSTTSNVQEDISEWIGHNVNMYVDMSEKHKSTFKYTCGKCACSFKSEVLLRKHERIHEHACKHCSQRFNSLPEYRAHKKTHDLTDTHFSCSVCGHSCEGLKNLMIHEMHHRLNSAFKQEIENFANSDEVLLKEQNEFDCEICQEHIVGMSTWLRHKIWHRWIGMWMSYVLGRCFQGTFTVEDAARLKHEVEAELVIIWRDCLKRKEIPINSRTKRKRTQDGAGSTAIQDQIHDNILDDTSTIQDQVIDDVLDDTSTIPNSVDGSEDKSDGESECEGISHAINGWMSYWQSYLGVDETPPSWVKPILKNLRSQWRNYHVNEQDLLYRKMDQIGVMIRAQKSGDSVSEGPWVCVPLRKKSVVNSTNGESSSTRQVNSKVRNFASSPNRSKPSDTSQSNKGSGLKRLTNLGSTVHKRTPLSLPSRHLRCRNLLSKNGVRDRLHVKDAQVSSQIKIVDQKSTSSPNLLGESSTYNLSKDCFTPMKQAVLSIPRLKWPLQCSSGLDEKTCSSKIIDASQSSANASSVRLPSLYEETLSLMKSEISGNTVPNWAENLIKYICDNSSLNEVEKKNKTGQVLDLLKSYYFHHMELLPKTGPVVVLNVL